jgi:hypothetical protein
VTRQGFSVDTCTTCALFHFQALPGIPLLPAGCNPASWMLDALASAAQPVMLPSQLLLHDASTGASPAALKTPLLAPTPDTILSGAAFQDAYFSNIRWQSVCRPKLDELCCTANSANVLAENVDRKPGDCPSFFSQLGVLASREWRSAARDIPFNGGRIGALIFLELLYGTAYYRMFFLATDLSGLQSLCAGIFNTNAFAVRTAESLVFRLLQRVVFFDIAYVPRHLSILTQGYPAQCGLGQCFIVKRCVPDGFCVFRKLSLLLVCPPSPHTHARLPTSHLLCSL